MDFLPAFRIRRGGGDFQAVPEEVAMGVFERVSPYIGILFMFAGFGFLGMAVGYGSDRLFWTSVLCFAGSLWFLVLVREVFDGRF